MKRSMLWPTACLLVAAAVLLVGGRARAPNVTWLPMTGELFDQAAVVRAHKLRVAEVGESWGRSWRTTTREHMCWPDDTTIRGPTVAAARTVDARAQCALEIRRALEPEFVPDGLEDHLVGLSGYGRTESDFLFGRYRTGAWNIQIIYSGHRTGILAVPARQTARHQAPAEYALRVARRLFVPPRPQDVGRIESRATLFGGLAHGGISNSDSWFGADPLTGPGPWYGVAFITDGSYVYLEPAKWGLRDAEVRLAGAAGGPEMPRPDETVLLFDRE